MSKVSVIIPVYNTSKYLHHCLDSVLSQTFAEFEIIIINDGSTDNSLEILREYEAKDNRIVVIDKNNEGVSAARNCGIKVAKGEYIMFCDSDDFVTPNWIEKLYEAIYKHPNSWVDCDYYKYDAVKNLVTPNHMKNITSDMVIPNSEYYIYYKNQNSHSCWNRIYKKDVLYSNNILFPVDISVGEDVLFNIEYIRYCDAFFHVSSELYYWNNDNNMSLSRKEDKKYYDTIKVLYFPRLSVVSQKDKQNFIDDYFYRFYLCLEKIYQNNNSKKDAIKYGNYILNDKEFIHALNNASDTACGKKLKMLLKTRQYRAFLLHKYLKN